MFTMLQILNKSKNIKLLFVVVAALQICLLAYYMSNKGALFLDETYTYSMANSSYGTLFPCFDLKYKLSTFNYNYKWLNGQFFRDYIAVSKYNRFDYSKIYEMHEFDSHPPLYCFLLHTLCSFFPESISKWYGFSLNILAFILVQLLLFNISKRIFLSEKYALFICLLYGFSACSVDCFVYIRMYSFLVMFSLLLLFFFIRCLKDDFSFLNLSGIVLTVYLGGLNHYHFFVYAFFLTLVFDIICIIEKKYKLFLYISFFTILGVLLAFISFPAIAFQLENTPRATEALDLGKDFYSSLNSISYFFQELFCCNSRLSNYLSILSLGLISILFVVLFAKKYIDSKNLSVFYITVIPTVLFFIFISFSVNFNYFKVNGQRFFWAVYPLIIIMVVRVLYKKKYLMGIFAILCIVSGFTMVDFNYSDKGKYNLELEEVFKENNIVLYYNFVEILQVLSIKLSECNKVLPVPASDKVWIPKDYPKNGKTYFVFFNYNANLDSSFKRVKSGIYYGLNYTVYELAKLVE